MEHFAVRREGICIEAELRMIGADLLVLVYGGDSPHIGAVSLAGPAAGPESGLVLEGHRDDAVTRMLSERLSKSWDATVCVAGGIHIDGITGAQIKLVLELCEELAGELEERLAERTGG